MSILLIDNIIFHETDETRIINFESCLFFLTINLLSIICCSFYLYFYYKIPYYQNNSNSLTLIYNVSNLISSFLFFCFFGELYFLQPSYLTTIMKISTMINPLLIFLFYFWIACLTHNIYVTFYNYTKNLDKRVKLYKYQLCIYIFILYIYTLFSIKFNERKLNSYSFSFIDNYRENYVIMFYLIGCFIIIYIISRLYYIIIKKTQAFTLSSQDERTSFIKKLFQSLIFRHILFIWYFLIVFIPVNFTMLIKYIFGFINFENYYLNFMTLTLISLNGCFIFMVKVTDPLMKNFILSVICCRKDFLIDYEEFICKENLIPEDETDSIDGRVDSILLSVYKEVDTSFVTFNKHNNDIKKYKSEKNKFNKFTSFNFGNNNFKFIQGINNIIHDKKEIACSKFTKIELKPCGSENEVGHKKLERTQSAKNKELISFKNKEHNSFLDDFFYDTYSKGEEEEYSSSRLNNLIILDKYINSNNHSEYNNKQENSNNNSSNVSFRISPNGSIIDGVQEMDTIEEDNNSNNNNEEENNKILLKRKSIRKKSVDTIYTKIDENTIKNKSSNKKINSNKNVCNQTPKFGKISSKKVGNYYNQEKKNINNRKTFNHRNSENILFELAGLKNSCFNELKTKNSAKIEGISDNANSPQKLQRVYSKHYKAFCHEEISGFELLSYHLEVTDNILRMIAISVMLNNDYNYDQNKEQYGKYYYFPLPWNNTNFYNEETNYIQYDEYNIPEYLNIKEDSRFNNFKFKVKSFCPFVFHHIRFIDRISTQDIINSLDPKKNLKMLKKLKVTGGRGDNCISTTWDHKFLIKTIDDNEKNLFINKMLEEYHCRMRDKQSTLSHVYGVFRIELNDKGESNVILQKNMDELELGPNILTFDLKGSTVDRQSIKKEDLILDKEELMTKYKNIVLKDVDLSIIDMKIELNISKGKILLNSIFNDSLFLEKFGVTDYSLLIFVYNYSENIMDKYFWNHRIVADVDRKYIFNFSIIDFLGTFGLEKRGEKLAKEFVSYIKYNKDRNFSCLDPLNYGDRFRNFVQKIIKYKEEKENERVDSISSSF